MVGKRTFLLSLLLRSIFFVLLIVGGTLILRDLGFSIHHKFLYTGIFILFGYYILFRDIVATPADFMNCVELESLCEDN